MPKQNKTNYCFQQAADPSVHLLYIYDDVSAYGNWNWNTCTSETSWQPFRKTTPLNYTSTLTADP